MTKKIVIIAMAFSVFHCIQNHAQPYMKLSKTDGTAQYYAIADIQKITFNELITGKPEIDAKTAKFFNQLKGFPNPTDERFTLEYSLSEKTPVVIKIYNMKGELVKQVVLGTMNAGNNTFVWDTKDNTGKQVTNGTYICHVITNTKLLSNKLIIIKQ